MAVIDPSTDIGRLRLRVADYGDIPFLSDDVYASTLVDTNNNLPQAASTIANYILGMLSLKTHRRLVNIEIWGAEAFANYKQFLAATINNPSLLPTGAISLYSASRDDCPNPIKQFLVDWDRNYSQGTQSQQLHWDARFYRNEYGQLIGYPSEAV